ADLTESTRTETFAKKYPERFIEIGVAEQNMASLAAGMALGGKIPYISSYAMFSPGRNWEQIRTTICYNEVNVKIAGAHTGVSVGPDGATHQAIEDIAIMRPIANMTVLVPCDAIEVKKATYAASKIVGPVYLRFAREKSPVFTTEATPFTVGKAEVFREGKDVAIIGCGPVLYNALAAAEELFQEGIDARVINNHTVKPMDEEAIAKAAEECGAVVTVEEHQVQGGMGSAVAEVLARRHPVSVELIGVANRFGESGAPEELVEKFGMGVEAIKEAVKKVLSRKR
ncbi:transketolase family protein, partial [Candidatus Azambacteria bacterium]|nr:transketolase family protein [Candidatus Azambacteria bacterium]